MTSEPTQVQITHLTDPDELFCRYPAEHKPQPVNLSLNLRTGDLTAAYNPEIGTGIPAAVYYRRVLWFPIPPFTAAAANDLLTDVAPIAQRILDGATIEWDGNNNIGVLNPDADDARDNLERLCADLLANDDPSTQVVEYSAGDWYAEEGAEVIARLGITADTTDADLARMAQDEENDAATTSNYGHVILTGTLDWLTRQRDELRENYCEQLTAAAERRAQLEAELAPLHQTITTGVHRLNAWKYTDRAIAAVIGRSHTAVQKMLRKTSAATSAEHPAADVYTYFADVDWTSDRIGVYATKTDPDDTTPDEQITRGDLEPVDPNDDSPAAADRRRHVITKALARLGWTPLPGAEWTDIEGGLGSEAGGLRVPVRPAR